MALAPMAVAILPDEDAGYVQATVNDNSQEHEQAEARVAALGYLCDSSTLYGHGGRDVFYLVGNPGWRLIWSRWEQMPLMSFARFDADGWNVVWEGSMSAFLRNGPQVDVVSPVPGHLRQLGTVLSRMRISASPVYCRWQGTDRGQAAAPLRLQVVALDPTYAGRELRVSRNGLRCQLVSPADGMNGEKKLAEASLAQLIGAGDESETVERLKLFLQTRERAASTAQINHRWKTFLSAVDSFLTR